MPKSCLKNSFPTERKKRRQKIWMRSFRRDKKNAGRYVELDSQHFL